MHAGTARQTAAAHRTAAWDEACSFAPGLFDGKSVVVTGGLSGIGAATARLLARLGAKVLVIGQSADPTAPPMHPNIRRKALDLSHRAATSAHLDALPALDVLVNAAELSVERDEYAAEHFDDVIGLNLGATMHACSRALPALAQRQGAVVNLASVYSLLGCADRPAYAASKGALVQLMRPLAQSYANVGVRVNAVAPGSIWGQLPADSASRRRQPARTPRARRGDADEVAAVTTFLCSPAARFTTGAVVPVDGGYHTL